MDKFFKMFGLTQVFDNDGGNDANNNNAGGGNADDNRGGGGGGDTGNKGNKGAADDSFKITVDGQEKILTREEVLKQAQLGYSSTKRFQDASDKEKKNAEKIRFGELVTNMANPEYNPSEAEVREFASAMGMDPGEFMDFLSDDGGNDGGNDNNDNNNSVDLSNIDEKTAQALIQKGLGLNPAEAKQILEYSHQRHISDAKSGIRKEIEKMVDKDEIFGKMIVGEGKSDKLAAINDLVEEDVLGKIKDGVPYGAELLAASIQKIRAYLSKFGTPGKPNDYPVTLGVGPSQGLPTEVLSEKPIERVSAAEDPDESNFIQRGLQRFIKARREAAR